MVRIGGGEPFLLHIEFLAWYRPEALRELARYGGSLAWQYQTGVESLLVLLRRDGVPEVLPTEARYEIGRTRTSHPFRVVRLWEIDPAPVLATGDPRLLAWILLLRSTDEQVRQAASILAEQSDEEAIGRFLLLSGIRYDENAAYELLRGGKMGFSEAVLEASSVAQGWAKKGVAQHARVMLRKLLNRNYPELERLSEIDQFVDAAKLDALCDLILDGTDADSLRQAILNAASPADGN
jgi:hypothetical protein